MEPERALRLLDSLDGLAYAARTACAGYWGQRLVFLTVGLGLALTASRLAALLA
jgi:hypothetical protein